MQSAADALVRTLEAHGVDHVFGVCGDTSVGLYRALEGLDHGIEHVLARDERSAAYMADAYARLSNRPGVCEGPSGGGATYLLPGLAEANDSAVPVVGLNTTIPVRYRGRGVLTELDQESIFDSVTTWSDAADHPDQVPRKLRSAFREATTGRPGASHLSLPIDVLDGRTEERTYADDAVTRCPAHRQPAENAAIERIRDHLAASERPVIVAGGGVHTSGAWTEVATLADRLGVPVAQSLTGAGCIGDHPMSIGVVGENGGRTYANRIVAEADLHLLLGTAVESVWTAKWSRPADGESTVVHLDVDAACIGRNYETDVGVPADLRTALQQLLAVVEPAQHWSPDELARRHAEWIEPYERRFDDDGVPLRPERMVAGARAVLDDDAVIVSDPGTSCPYFAALYPFPEPGRHWVTPRAHGALGYAIPGVIGAHHARPDAQIVGFTGDGSAGTSLGDLETLARLDLPVTVVVVNNESFSWIEAGQRNYRGFSFGVEFGDVEFASVAEAFGLAGFAVESADEYEATLRDAVTHDGPALVDLPVRPLPAIDDAPVQWLTPED